jgi:hypothetical protein
VEKLLRWAIFGVIVALVPLAFAYVSLMLNGTPDLSKVLGNGELLIVVSAICAGGVGELIGSGNEYQAWKIISGGLTVVVLILSALLFANVIDHKGGTYNENTVEYISLSMFVFGVLSCGSCISLSEL